ncbi:hydrogenase maturation nickel metallochaperone HypA [bacterium]|nr:hydrogenase maturation nickel metallochaperone HypA [bacterium]
MHEVSIAQNIINQVESILADNKGNKKVKKVFIRVGKLSCVIPNNLSFIFNILTAETPMSDAKLEIEIVQVLCKCQRCESSFEIKENGFVCPHCNSYDIEVISGRELLIDKVEVE